jgi:hypothetical protein
MPGAGFEPASVCLSNIQHGQCMNTFTNRHSNMCCNSAIHGPSNRVTVVRYIPADFRCGANKEHGHGAYYLTNTCPSLDTQLSYLVRRT